MSDCQGFSPYVVLRFIVDPLSIIINIFVMFGLAQKSVDLSQSTRWLLQAQGVTNIIVAGISGTYDPFAIIFDPQFLGATLSYLPLAILMLGLFMSQGLQVSMAINRFSTFSSLADNNFQLDIKSSNSATLALVVAPFIYGLIWAIVSMHECCHGYLNSCTAVNEVWGYGKSVVYWAITVADVVVVVMLIVIYSITFYKMRIIQLRINKVERKTTVAQQQLQNGLAEEDSQQRRESTAADKAMQSSKRQFLRKIKFEVRVTMQFMLIAFHWLLHAVIIFSNQVVLREPSEILGYMLKFNNAAETLLDPIMCLCLMKELRRVLKYTICSRSTTLVQPFYQSAIETDSKI